jgi:hypothetical protein
VHQPRRTSSLHIAEPAGIFHRNKTCYLHFQFNQAISVPVVRILKDTTWLKKGKQTASKTTNRVELLGYVRTVNRITKESIIFSISRNSHCCGPSRSRERGARNHLEVDSSEGDKCRVLTRRPAAARRRHGGAAWRCGRALVIPRATARNPVWQEKCW